MSQKTPLGKCYHQFNRITGLFEKKFKEVVVKKNSIFVGSGSNHDKMPFMLVESKSRKKHG